MDKFDHIQQLHRLFVSHRYPIKLNKLAQELELGEKQTLRHIHTLRDIVDAPLEYSEEHKGWRYDSDVEVTLPGLWLTANELQSLSLVLSILKGFESASLSDSLQPIEATIHKLLQSRKIDSNAFHSHVKALSIGNRQLNNKIFHKVAEAALQSKRLTIVYNSYERQKTERTVSPQNILYYRDNWYLDAYCHLRKELRTFSVARIETAELSKTPAEQRSEVELIEHFTGSYGLFAGKAKHTATLRFSPKVAREIAMQQWHPQQVGEWQGSYYVLQIPYAKEAELLQDILRHTPNVYVEAPEALCKALQEQLAQGLALNKTTV